MFTPDKTAKITVPPLTVRGFVYLHSSVIINIIIITSIIITFQTDRPPFITSPPPLPAALFLANYSDKPVGQPIANVLNYTQAQIPHIWVGVGYYYGFPKVPK